MVSGEIILGGSEKDARTIPLATKSGAWIQNEQREEHAPERLAAALRIMKSSFPQIEMRSVSATYNCTGLVFGVRRTWIDGGRIDWILREDGYRRILQDAAFPGDLVVYRRRPELMAEHVGILLRSDKLLGSEIPLLKVLSQWGADGEYIHHINHVPECYGRHLDFYTERQIP